MSVGIHSGPIHLFRVGSIHQELVIAGSGGTTTTSMEKAADPGEILVSAMGTTPSLGARLAKATFAPDLLMTDGFNLLLRRALPLGAKPSDDDVEGWMPFGSVFDTLWWGRRHVMMGASQIDQYGNQNIACIGAWETPNPGLLTIEGGTATGVVVPVPAAALLGMLGLSVAGIKLRKFA